MECENELALLVIQGIEKNRQMATRDTELVLWLWRASEYCTKVRGTLHSRAIYINASENIRLAESVIAIILFIFLL